MMYYSPSFLSVKYYQTSLRNSPYYLDNLLFLEYTIPIHSRFILSFVCRPKLGGMDLLKAVIFDMDGVIIDSEPLHAQAAVMALQQYNITISPEYCSRFIGSTTYYMCQKILEDFPIDATPEELLQANNEMKQLLVTNKGYTAIPYVVDLIKNLYEHGLSLIIASSSTSEAIEYVMDSLSIRDYFHGYISGMEVSRPKPAPDIFCEAAKRLKLKPEECIIIEDSMNGVNAAHAAEITCIGYINPHSGPQNLRNAAILVEGFDEIDYEFIQSIHQAAHREKQPVVITDRLIIKEMPLEDVEAWCLLCEETDSTHDSTYYSGSIDEEREKHKVYIHSIYDYYGFGLWGVYQKENNRLIGRCGIEYKSFHGSGEYELSYMIGSPYQRQGFGKEAVSAVLHYVFHHVGAKYILAVIDKSNIISQRFAERLQMKPYGTIIRNQRECYLYRIEQLS